MMRELLRDLFLWAVCLVRGHDWRVAGVGHPDSASPYEYHECARCGDDSREAWEIQDDTYCRQEQIHLKLRNPKDWSPRWRSHGL